MRFLSIYALTTSLFCHTLYANFTKDFESTTCKTPHYNLSYNKSNKKLFLTYKNDNQKREIKGFKSIENEISLEQHYMYLEEYKRALNKLQREESISKDKKENQKIRLLRSEVKALYVIISSAYYKGLKMNEEDQLTGLFKFYNREGKFVGSVTQLNSYEDRFICE